MKHHCFFSHQLEIKLTKTSSALIYYTVCIQVCAKRKLCRGSPTLNVKSRTLNGNFKFQTPVIGTSMVAVLEVDIVSIYLSYAKRLSRGAYSPQICHDQKYRELFVKLKKTRVLRHFAAYLHLCGVFWKVSFLSRLVFLVLARPFQLNSTIRQDLVMICEFRQVAVTRKIYPPRLSKYRNIELDCLPKIVITFCTF